MNQIAEFFGNLLGPGDWPARWSCGRWTDFHGWLYILSDVAIAAAYFAIPVLMVWFITRRRDLPFPRVFWLFAAFILACGSTHVADAAAFWWPAYRLNGLVLLATAIVSWVTVFALLPVLPQAVALRSPKELDAVNRRLSAAYEQVAERERELLNLNHRLQRLDRMKTRFFANVSHELRTPLALILGPVEKLRADQALDEARRRDLEGVDRNARTLLAHVNDLLDVAKLEADKMTARYAGIDLARLVRRTASQFDAHAQERRIAYAVDAPASVPAKADPDKVHRILMNLLSNAFKFTPEGGTVRCVLRVEPPDGPAAAGHAILTVADSGPGVPPGLRDSVFERFFQAEDSEIRRFGGTGLGLSIARDFAGLHGGSIAVGDAPEGGALFTVRLPLAAPSGATVHAAPDDTARAAEVSADPVPPPRETSGARSPADAPTAETEAGRPLVLVVEDNPEMNRFIRETLAGTCRTEGAFDGREGVEKALRLKPDLIVSDVMMPGMSGAQLAVALREHRELDAVPLVVLTAKADDALRLRMLREGAQDYLVKPFSSEELRIRVAHLVALKRAREAIEEQNRTLEARVAERTAAVEARSRELARSNRELEQFAYVASHDLREPLRMVTTYMELLQQRFHEKLDPPADQYIRHAVDGSRRMHQMISDLLAFSQMDHHPDPPQRVDCGEVLDAALADLRKAVEDSGARIVRGPLPAVMGSRALLVTLLQNLISNAIKYRGQAPPRVEVAAERRGDAWVISVRDNGIGIDPQYHERIFHLFQRLHERGKYPGSGIGLATAKKIVERHGGRIWVESRDGEGAAFCFTLPAAAPESPIPCAAAAGAGGGNGHPAA